MQTAVQGFDGYVPKLHLTPQKLADVGLSACKAQFFLDAVCILAPDCNGCRGGCPLQRFHLYLSRCICVRQTGPCPAALALHVHIHRGFHIPQGLHPYLERDDGLDPQLPGVNHIRIQVLQHPVQAHIILFLQPRDIDHFLKRDVSSQGLKSA